MQGREEKILSEFNSVWEKPFSEIIEEVCNYDPKALHQFHLRMRKGAADDLAVIDNTVEQFKKKKEISRQEKTLILVHENYHLLENENTRQEIQEIVEEEFIGENVLKM